MAAASSQSRRSSGPVLRSLSPHRRLQTHNNYRLSSSSSSASAFASSTSSSFYSQPSTFFQNSHQRSESLTRVNVYSASPPLSPSFCFSIDQPISPNRSLSVSKKNHSHPISAPTRGCMCSPTTHRGSFRCSLHKNTPSSTSQAPFTPNRLNMRRSAMTNSLVRIGGVEGEWVKRALTALIRPSSHQQRRRGAFQSRLSRLSITSNADDEIC
ncbi:protein TPRXL [Salix suchowensis]|nr:protein TPRXL [Salix suchowensis]